MRILIALIATTTPAAAFAQQSEPATREEVIEHEEAEKVETLHPYVLSTGERVMNEVEDKLTNGMRWHPFFESAYQGGGFPFGVGYMVHVSPYNLVDVRGSYTLAGYKRAEAEFTAPHLFHRRGTLSLLGGWREATEVGFFGTGSDSAEDQRTNYEVERPYASGTLTFQPTRRHWLLLGGLEWTQWSQQPGQGTFPSVDTAFTPQTLPGLGAKVTYIHSQGSLGFDWRPSSGYARRGGYYGVTVHDYTDTNNAFGFNQVDYEAVQHFPILREAWVITLRGHAETAYGKEDQQIPFYMLPSLGGGSTLRGYSSWRFRDNNSLLLQAEWRVMVNRFFDTAFFYDTGKVAARASDLDLDGMQHDTGFGFRFHSPDATVLRFDVARSHEGVQLVFAASRAF